MCVFYFQVRLPMDQDTLLQCRVFGVPKMQSKHHVVRVSVFFNFPDFLSARSLAPFTAKCLYRYRVSSRRRSMEKLLLRYFYFFFSFHFFFLLLFIKNHF